MPRLATTLSATSLVCSLAQILVVALPGIAAIILGAVALRQIKSTGQQGKGMAIAGIIIGSLGVVLGGILVGVIIYAIQHAAPCGTTGASC